MPALTDIQHVVVLMLENRSFDNLFGYLYTQRDDFDGLAGKPASNPGPGGVPIPVWTDPLDPGAANLPSPDPGETFYDITQQLSVDGTVSDPPPMNGFTTNYVAHGGVARDIMHCFMPQALPALSTLATQYAVADRWFASAPCQTWPNRFFVHAGTANGYENNTLDGFPFHMQTIFNELQGRARWRIYFHDFSSAALLSRLWPLFGNFRPFDEFLDDVNSADMPAYAFIEPQFYPGLEMPSDMHPPHDIRYADALVARVYNAVRASPNWPSTLLVIIFDEHGGCYDHVPPPPAVPPEPARPGQAFAFDRYGVRVPAVVVSAATRAGTVLKPPGATPFDHTSIIRTVRRCFDLDTPLSAREAVAPDLSGALNMDFFDKDHPPSRLDVAAPGAPSTLQSVWTAPLSRLQALLHEAAAQLAPLVAGAGIDTHLAALVQANSSPTPVVDTAGAAGAQVRDVMTALSARFPGRDPA